MSRSTRHLSRSLYAISACPDDGSNRQRQPAGAGSNRPSGHHPIRGGATAGGPTGRRRTAGKSPSSTSLWTRTRVLPGRLPCLVSYFSFYKPGGEATTHLRRIKPGLKRLARIKTERLKAVTYCTLF